MSSPTPGAAIDCGGVDRATCRDALDAVLADARAHTAAKVTLHELDISSSDVLAEAARRMLGKTLGEPLIFVSSVDVRLADGMLLTGYVARHRTDEPMVVNLWSQPEEACRQSGNAQPVAFAHGQAVVVLGTGNRVTLDRMGDATISPRFEPSCPAGAQSAWTDASGAWLLTVMANVVPAPGAEQAFGYATLEWYPGTDPPLFADASACPATITEIDARGLVGHIECRGLRWLNGYDAQTRPGLATPLPQFAAFDASITFEARP